MVWNPELHMTTMPRIKVDQRRPWNHLLTLPNSESIFTELIFLHVCRKRSWYMPLNICWYFLIKLSWYLGFNFFLVLLAQNLLIFGAQYLRSGFLLNIRWYLLVKLCWYFWLNICWWRFCSIFGVDICRPAVLRLRLPQAPLYWPRFHGLANTTRIESRCKQKTKTQIQAKQDKSPNTQ